MNPFIKIRKFTFTKKASSLKLTKKENEFLIQPPLKYLDIRLIEISGDIDPSDFIVVIKTKVGTAEYINPIYLYEHRTNFMFQNNKFILNTANIRHLNRIATNDFDISVISESKKDFELVMYYNLQAIQ